VRPNITGEYNPKCKLKDYQVRGIRAIPRNSRPTQIRLAEIYGVTQDTIYRILANKSRMSDTVSQ
jgi:hypothetical protein